MDIMLVGSGSIRTTELGPIVLLSDFTECFPYDDVVHMLNVSGAQLRRMIHYMLRDEVWEGSHCEFYQFSQGLHVVYDKQSRQFKEFTLNDEPISDNRIYRIGLQHYHFVNLVDSFGVQLSEVEENGETRVIATSCREILEEYLSSHQNLDRQVCGRLIIA